MFADIVKITGGEGGTYNYYINRYYVTDFASIEDRFEVTIYFIDGKERIYQFNTEKEFNNALNLLLNGNSP